MRRTRLALLLALLAVPATAAPRPTHGVASGDVTSSSAVIWARSSEPAEMQVEVWATGKEPRALRAWSSHKNDLTAQVEAVGLVPATLYHYRVRFANENGVSEPVAGSFTTAPAAANGDAPLRFIVGGDVGGQGYCRHAERGYDVYRVMAELEPDFFIANGDMIYADGDCPARGPGGWPNVPGDFPRIDAPGVEWTDRQQVREVYLDHWRYNRADPHVQEFHSQVPVWAQWDDHEVINDFGAPWQTWSKSLGRRGYPVLVEEGRAALFAWNPIRRHPDEPFRVYRSFSWGTTADVFLLDARSYRSLNDRSERPENAKTLLGEEQFAWLTEGLRNSRATWKILSSDVPLSVPTGSEAEQYGRDGWADGERWDSEGFAARTGFEAELHRLLRILDENDVENVVFVVTDVHFAMSLRYDVDIDGDGDTLLFHEFLSGPLNAVRADPPGLDPSYRPIILYAEGGLFNFSLLEIERRADGVSVLRSEIRDARGEIRFGSRVELEARPRKAKDGEAED